MNISKRVKDRRKHLGLSQEELAERVGVSQNAIHKLEDGTTKKPRNIFEIARVLRCDPEWLLHGVESRYSTSNIITPINTLQGRYPVLDWVQAGNFTAAYDIHPDDIDYYPCPVKCSENTFLLKVRGQSMAGTFNEGDLVFIDPEVQATNGKFVVARLDNENEATLKQLIIEGTERYLKATNPDWPNKILPINGDCTIIGVVIFAGKSF